MSCQNLCTNHRSTDIKKWGKFYSNHLEYDIPQDEGYQYDPITFRPYLANLTSKTGKYDGDQLFRAISCDKYPTTVNFMYFPHHEVEATHVLNGLLCIISEELLINSKNFITISGIDIATMGIWDKEKRTFTNPNELHNE